MKRWMMLLLALMLACAAPVALGEDRDETDITVQGTATVTAAPDVVTVIANASVNAPTVAEAQSQMSAIIARVTETLLALGVQEDDIVTQSFSYYPDYNYQTEVRTLLGYQANHVLNITCRDVDMLDAVVSAVTDGGMSEIYSVNYDLADRTALYKQALALAVQATRDKAECMAQAAGMRVTGLEEVRENGGYDMGVYANATMDAGMSLRAEEAAGGTGIRSGSVSVTASVTAVYAAEK